MWICQGLKKPFRRRDSVHAINLVNVKNHPTEHFQGKKATIQGLGVLVSGFWFGVDLGVEIQAVLRASVQGLGLLVSVFLVWGGLRGLGLKAFRV